VSYLDFPRLHFAGRFQADVASVNNLPSRYDNDAFQPRFQWAGVQRFIDGGFNPRGSNAFRLQGCQVTSAWYGAGRIAVSSAVDRVVGGTVAGADRRVSATMADLDPDIQLTKIWGLGIRLLDSRGVEVCRGEFAPAWFSDSWVRQPTAQPPEQGAYYHSVLTGVTWADGIESEFLRQLRDTSEPGMLTVKFNIDGYVLDMAAADYRTGRIVGSIGPYRRGEPRQVVPTRLLRAGEGTTLFDAPFRVDEQAGVVLVDLGNSIRTTAPGGPLADIGAPHLAVLPATGPPEIVAPLVDIDQNFYRQRAGISEVRTTPAQLHRLTTNRVALVDAARQSAILLAENDDASLVRAEERLFHIYPGTSVSTTIVVTRFGRPAAGVELSVRNPAPPGQAIVDVPERLVTDDFGRATLKLTGRDPGNPRRFIDGQVTVLRCGQASAPESAEGLGVHVWQAHPVPNRPTWVTDIQPIFQQYANLYPVMRHVLDLANYHHVVTYRNAIRRSLLEPVEVPGHMPASRDLSPGKRDTIVRWLDIRPEPPMLEIDTPEELKRVLQLALSLEHATIPVYLAGLFSIMPDRNLEVARIIRGVVIEEMLHMALVANILNAIGGRPRVGRPGFVPTYPGHLPGGVLPDLVVTLRKCSIQQVRDVFMAIERPDCPTVDGEPFTGAVIDRALVRTDERGRLVDRDQGHLDALAKWFIAAEYQPFTIGWFYNQIAMAVVRLDQQMTLFTGDPSRQLCWPDAPGILYQVTDRSTALLAIHEIIEQGEGSPQDLEQARLTDRTQFGHYYRFKEIVEGRELVRNEEGRWTFEGPEIPFDPTGVLPMIDDPDTYALPPNPQLRRQSLLCDELYRDLLAALDFAFDGHPGTLNEATKVMYSFEVEAKRLLGMPIVDGQATTAGPAFQA
jgi:Ferritin-like